MSTFNDVYTGKAELKINLKKVQAKKAEELKQHEVSADLNYDDCDTPRSSSSGIGCAEFIALFIMGGFAFLFLGLLITLCIGFFVGGISIAVTAITALIGVHYKTILMTTVSIVLVFFSTDIKASEINVPRKIMMPMLILSKLAFFYLIAIFAMAAWSVIAWLIANIATILSTILSVILFIVIAFVLLMLAAIIIIIILFLIVEILRFCLTPRG